MTGVPRGHDDEIEALIVDRYLESLLARRPQPVDDLPEALALSRRDGLAQAARIAAEHGPRLGIDVAEARDYLTRVLSYDLGEPEIAGLRQFARLAARLGLAPEGADIVFHRPQHLAARR